MSKQVLVFRYGCPCWLDEEDVSKSETIYGCRGTIEPYQMGHRHAGVWLDKDIPERYATTMSQIVYKPRANDGRWAEVMPEQISFYGTTTVCKFPDGKYTSARPQKGENFDKETGVAMCIAKYIYGSRSKFLRAVEKGHQQ